MGRSLAWGSNGVRWVNSDIKDIVLEFPRIHRELLVAVFFFRGWLCSFVTSKDMGEDSNVQKGVTSTPVEESPASTVSHCLRQRLSSFLFCPSSAVSHCLRISCIILSAQHCLVFCQFKCHIDFSRGESNRTVLSVFVSWSSTSFLLVRVIFSSGWERRIVLKRVVGLRIMSYVLAFLWLVVNQCSVSNVLGLSIGEAKLLVEELNLSAGEAVYSHLFCNAWRTLVRGRWFGGRVWALTSSNQLLNKGKCWLPRGLLTRVRAMYCHRSCLRCLRTLHIKDSISQCEVSRNCSSHFLVSWFIFWFDCVVWFVSKCWTCKWTCVELQAPTIM